MPTVMKAIISLPAASRYHHLRFLPSTVSKSTAHSPLLICGRPCFDIPQLTVSVGCSGRFPAVQATSCVTNQITATPESSPPVRIVTIVGKDSVSPLKNTPWEQVMLHTAEKLTWVDEGYKMLVFNDEIITSNDDEREDLRRALSRADILLVVAVTDKHSVEWLRNNTGKNQNMVCFDSCGDLRNKLGGRFVNHDAEDGFFGSISSLIQSSKDKESVEVLKRISESWGRRNSDDIRFCLLVLIDAYVRPVAILKSLKAKGFSVLSCVLKNCGTEILNCLLDPDCRQALQCLNGCGSSDQVCCYDCISSYESPHLEAFTLCMFEKHNCMNLTAEIPSKPSVPPLAAFRGEQLTHEIAEDIFVGWLGRLDWSWRVVAGLNPAYDRFPCQYKLFYRGEDRRSFWYEPVFKVKTLKGQCVWRKRRYQIQRGSVPGTFFFKVLDNGVVSEEIWTIVDVCDDLSWGLFYYSGAARSAGQSYTGAILVSPDGNYPPESGSRKKLASALEKCRIKHWEMNKIENSSCANPPLGIPVGANLHQSIELTDMKPLLNFKCQGKLSSQCL